MKTTNHCQNHSAESPAGRFCRRLQKAVSQLKERLISRNERLAPERSGLIRAAVAEAESAAWETPFPHLFFPDFAEARLAAVTAQAA